MGCVMDVTKVVEPAVNRFSGLGTWEREARRVALLAAEQCRPLDEETLLLYDVRELPALRRRLESGRVVSSS